MQRAKVLIIGAGLLLAAGTAFAQGDGDGSGSGGAPMPPPEGNGSAAPAPSGGGFGDLPISDRPLTLPKSAIGIYGGFAIAEKQTPAMGMVAASTATNEALQIGAGYGISDKLTAGFDYTMVFNNSAKGPLQLYGEYQLAHSSKLEVAAGGAVVIDLNSPVTEGLALGVNLRYTLMPKLVVFTGTPLAPAPAGNQFKIGFNSGAKSSIDLPVGVGYQAMPKLFAWLDTNIAHIKIANDANGVIFADFIPVEVGALYSVNKQIDVGAAIVDDFKHAGDTFSIALLGRYTMAK
jgi:hypothetical protein